MTDNTYKLVEIKIYNIANGCELLSESKMEHMGAGNIAGLILCPFTLGISGDIVAPSIMEKSTKMISASARLSKCTKEELEKTRNMILTPTGFVQLEAIVPINENPQVTATFQNLQTHEYITVWQ